MSAALLPLTRRTHLENNKLVHFRHQPRNLQNPDMLLVLPALSRRSRMLTSRNMSRLYSVSTKMTSTSRPPAASGSTQRHSR